MSSIMNPWLNAVWIHIDADALLIYISGMDVKKYLRMWIQIPRTWPLGKWRDRVREYMLEPSTKQAKRWCLDSRGEGFTAMAIHLGSLQREWICGNPGSPALFTLPPVRHIFKAVVFWMIQYSSRWCLLCLKFIRVMSVESRLKCSYRMLFVSTGGWRRKKNERQRLYSCWMSRAVVLNLYWQRP